MVGYSTLKEDPGLGRKDNITNGSLGSLCSKGGRGEPDGQESMASLDRTVSPPREAAAEDLYTWMAKQQEFTESKREKVKQPQSPITKAKPPVCNCKIMIKLNVSPLGSTQFVDFVLFFYVFVFFN